MTKYGKTHCPYCERPLAGENDYDRYEGGEGEHLCWAYPHSFCYAYGKDGDERVIELLTQRDKARRWSALWKLAAKQNRADFRRVVGYIARAAEKQDIGDLVDTLISERNDAARAEALARNELQEATKRIEQWKAGYTQAVKEGDEEREKWIKAEGELEALAKQSHADACRQIDDLAKENAELRREIARRQAVIDRLVDELGTK